MQRWHRWAQGCLDRAVEARPAHNPHGEARVWALHAEGRAIAYLKQHRVIDKWRRERALLEHLAAAPDAPPRVRCPPLVACESAGLVLLLGALPGTLASRGTGSSAERHALHEQAGRFRRWLDAVPVDEADPTPLPVAMAQRHRAWLARARAHLPPARLTRVERALDPECFAGAARRWCHRDLAPHNWIVDPTPAGPALGIIDFGQARPDVWLVDVLKLWDRSWVEHPSLAEAFWAGYGRRPDPAERRQLAQLGLLHGLATATWGERHGHPELATHGQAVLERALAEVTA